MRIVIDMQGAQTGSRFRGIGRYTLSLVQAMARTAKDHEFILALNGLLPESIEPIREAFRGLVPQENIRVWHAPGPVHWLSASYAPRRAIAERVREAFLEALEPDVVLVTSLFEGIGEDAVISIGTLGTSVPTAVILYDLIPLLSPDENFRSNPIHRGWYAHRLESLKQARHLLAISESARQEALSALTFPPEQVTTVSGACDAMFIPVTPDADHLSTLRQRLGLTRPFIMYTGGADARKNLRHLIEAFARLPRDLRQGHQLLFVGRMPPPEVDALRTHAQGAGLRPDELVFTDYIDDEDLLILFSTCRLFVFPSLHEGFGLPPLEAMACGAVVIAADSSSLPEVMGSAEALFDPQSVHAISAKMQQALTDEDLRARLLENARTQARAFSWGHSARLALQALAAFKRPDTAPPTQVAPMRQGMQVPRSRLLQALAPLTPQCEPAELIQLARDIALSLPERRHRMLFVDASELVHGDARTGIQRVVRSVLKELLGAPPPAGFEIQPVYASRDRAGFRYANGLVSRLLEQDDAEAGADDPIDFQAGDVFLGLDMNLHAPIDEQPFLDEMHRCGVRVLFVVYDLLCVQMPDCFPMGVPELFEPWLNMLPRYDGVVCGSRTVAGEFTEWLKLHYPQRQGVLEVGWFHYGADIHNSQPSVGMPEDAAQVLQALRAAPSFLMVGTVEPRKGYAQALAAFERLWKEGLAVNLVIVGKPGWLVNALIKRLRAHPQLGKRLFWLEGISDEYLDQIYSACCCLLAASRGEGFGLPLIEAASKHLPILARDLPVFREVAQGHAQYFHADDGA
ncbi:MAG: glycosyltransferase family 1 protein, partial [Xenophilus sp.]